MTGAAQRSVSDAASAAQRSHAQFVQIYCRQRRRLGWLGPALLGCSAVGLLLAAVFPIEQDAAGVAYDPGRHFLSGVTFFGSSALALLALSGLVIAAAGALAPAGWAARARTASALRAE